MKKPFDVSEWWRNSNLEKMSTEQLAAEGVQFPSTKISFGWLKPFSHFKHNTELNQSTMPIERASENTCRYFYEVEQLQ